MGFPLARRAGWAQGPGMAAHVRFSFLLLVAGSLAALWRVAGMLPAVAAAFGILACLLVLGMRLAVDEITQFERDQRPDLQRFD